MSRDTIAVVPFKERVTVYVTQAVIHGIEDKRFENHGVYPWLLPCPIEYTQAK